MSTVDPDDAIGAVAALADPLRRRLYRFIAAQDHAVGRDEAAEGVGASRSAAAFHLDRLVGDGLLEAEFRRLTGRRGPGAGRPAKLYRRANRDISLSLPARRYQLAATLLAGAVTEAGASGCPVGDVLDRLAGRCGARIAGGLETGGPAAAVAARVADALAAEGYEARADDAEVVLGNCPFSGIVADHAELVCRMNLALLRGFSEAVPGAAVTAQLRPGAGACCVRLRCGAAVDP